jgi:dynein heavy chain
VDKYQWLIFDGALDKTWVENMNSVLDDNKKLALITGEAVPLDSRMRIVFETDDLSNCSPGTISRCGLLYMEDKGISLKALANNYVRKLPKILNGQVEKFDRMVNYFIPDILDHFINEEKASSMLYPITQKFALQNFLQYFEAYIADYRSPRFGTWKTVKSALEARTEEERNEDGISLPYLRKMHKAKYHHTVSYYEFSESDQRMRNAIIFRDRWVECFFI